MAASVWDQVMGTGSSSLATTSILTRSNFSFAGDTYSLVTIYTCGLSICQTQKIQLVAYLCPHTFKVSVWRSIHFVYPTCTCMYSSKVSRIAPLHFKFAVTSWKMSRVRPESLCSRNVECYCGTSLSCRLMSGQMGRNGEGNCSNHTVFSYLDWRRGLQPYNGQWLFWVKHSD